ncbi:MAG: cytochrome c [Halobacteriovoraceae bacterium]|nr:cytochrome c [Halobacteriovoraceae bacterium]
MKKIFFVSTVFLWCFPCWSQEIRFYKKDKLIKILSLREMQKIAGKRDIKLRYHFSKSPIKNYRGMPIIPILKKVYKSDLKDENYTEFILEALDGYQSYSSRKTLLTSGGYIVFKDLDVKKGWESVGFKQVSPAPYFLVWIKKEQTVANEYPWPWALSKIHLVRMEDRYPKVYPKGFKKNSAIYKGYKIFKAQCFRCHSIDRQGGKIGPDLAAPQNILDYRSEKFIRQFIKKPSSFRYSKMPSHSHLSEKALDDLIAYLRSR